MRPVAFAARREPRGTNRAWPGTVHETRDSLTELPDLYDALIAALSTSASPTVAADLVTRLEAERAARRMERERAGQFYRTMLGVVGHDMRAPVAAILIATEMLVAKHHDDPALTGLVGRMVSFANRMTAMVDQLLDLSRAQLGGGIPLQRVELRLGPVVALAVDELAQRYPRSRFSVSGEAARKGVWDGDRLRQVITSLVTNAVHHGEHDGPITIVLSQDETLTTVDVHNECEHAIPAEALPRLFEPHRASDDEHSRAGAGLGLYIVREIVEAHGGCVAVDSSAAGTTFRVALPNDKRLPGV